VASVLHQKTPDVTVIVSENSGPGLDRSTVVAALPPDLELLVPDSELAMSDHWNWALEQVEQRFRPTHVTFLTDRMIFKDDSLSLLAELIGSHPDEVITYNHDRVDDWNQHKVRLSAYSGDGYVYVMDSRSVLQMTASGQPYQWTLPRMLNCVVPIEVFAEMRSEVGHVFASISPDFYFGSRVLALRDTFLSLNYSLLAHHSSLRSNGNSLATGVVSGDARDFRKRTSLAKWNTPFPDVDTLGNAILHEYSTVRELTGSDRFPPLDEESVRGVLLSDADAMIDRDVANLVRARVGLNTRPRAPRSMRGRLVSALHHPGRTIGPRVTYGPIPLRVAVKFQRVLPGGVFRSVDDALAVASASPRPVLQPLVPGGTLRRVSRPTSRARISARRRALVPRGSER
jgi:hypothetical protein